MGAQSGNSATARDEGDCGSQVKDEGVDMPSVALARGSAAPTYGAIVADDVVAVLTILNADLVAESRLLINTVLREGETV